MTSTEKRPQGKKNIVYIKTTLGKKAKWCNMRLSASEVTNKEAEAGFILSIELCISSQL